MSVRSLLRLQWPRHTERLTIRPARPEDAEAVFAYRALPEVGRWTASLPTDRAAFRQAFSFSLAQSLVLARSSAAGQVIGTLTLAVQDAWAQREARHLARDSQADLGWSLHPEAQGMGLGTEAVRELLAIALEPRPDGLGLRRVTAYCMADNVACVRLMERVEMRREGYRVGDFLHRDGTWRDSTSYALTAAEWRARRHAALPE